MTTIKISRPLFRVHQWPLRTLRDTFAEWASVDSTTQVAAAQAVLCGWPLVLTLRRVAGNRHEPLGRESAFLLGALLDHRDKGECGVWLHRADGFESIGPSRHDGDVLLADVLDPCGRWTAANALTQAGERGLANRLEHTANAWHDYPLTVHEVLVDDPTAEAIVAALATQPSWGLRDST